MFQKLSVGKVAPDQALCDLFDRETENGAKIDKHSGLLARRSTPSSARSRNGPLPGYNPAGIL